MDRRVSRLKTHLECLTFIRNAIERRCDDLAAEALLRAQEIGPVDEKCSLLQALAQMISEGKPLPPSADAQRVEKKSPIAWRKINRTSRVLHRRVSYLAKPVQATAVPVNPVATDRPDRSSANDPFIQQAA